jgi:hypothetical protein
MRQGSSKKDATPIKEEDYEDDLSALDDEVPASGVKPFNVNKKS